VAAVVPVAPVQFSEYVVVAEGVTLSEPEVAWVPVQPVAPEAVQLVALVVDQVSIDELPATTLAGVAANVTVGFDGGVTVIVTVPTAGVVPAAPEHVNV